MLAPTLSGLLAGAVHALSGPDHLAAVVPLSVTARHRAWQVGMTWGFGHALGVFVTTLIVLPLRHLLELQFVSQWLERMVGVLLIGVGVWGIRKASSRWIHTHRHQHGDEEHIHIHTHGTTRETEDSHNQHSHAPLAVGLLHGLAGTTHLVGLLPALALTSTVDGVSYLLGYGFGNLLAMALFAWMLGKASSRLSGDGIWSYRTMLGACSAGAIAIGVVWLLG